MKRFNLDQFIWFIILLGLLVSIGFLFFSGKIFLLIATKMRVYVILTIVFLAIMILIQIPKIFTVASRGGVKKGHIFFIMLIFSLIIVSNIDIMKNSLIMKGVVIEHHGHKHNKEHNHEITEAVDNIIVEKDNFHNIIEAINENIDNYVDKEITIEGLLYNNEVAIGDFVITQIDMNCCMVDSSFLGITCVGSTDFNVETGDYVRAKGKVKIIEYKGNKLGAIYIDEIERYK